MRRSHNVGSQIDEQIVIDYRSGPFPKLGPRSIRACTQFRHLQKASGKAFVAAVPRKVMIIGGSPSGDEPLE